MPAPHSLMTPILTLPLETYVQVNACADLAGNVTATTAIKHVTAILGAVAFFPH